MGWASDFMHAIFSLTVIGYDVGCSISPFCW